MKKIILIVFIITASTSAQNNPYLIRTLTGHLDNVRSIDFSPDGKTLVSGSNDNTIKLWDLTDGHTINTFNGHTDDVRSVSFSPDGNSIVSGSDDNKIMIWRTNDSRLIRTISGHKSLVLSVSISPDGLTIASGSGDNTAKLWRFYNGELISSFDNPSMVVSLKFDPSGNIIALGGNDGIIKLWNIKGGYKTISGHIGKIFSLAFSPDGKTIASSSADKTIKLWNVSDGRLISTLIGHKNAVSAIDYSKDGKFIISGSYDGSVKVWKVLDGSLLNTLSDWNEKIFSVAISPDGKRIASAGTDNTIQIWDFPLDAIYENALLERYPELFKPKDEFETTLEFQARSLKAESLKKQLITELIEEKKQKAELERNIKEKEIAERIKNSKEFGSLKIESVGNYNADEETFPITINNKTKKIKIPRSAAREFKENWQKAKVTGWKQLTNDLTTYEYYDIIITHPITGVEYLFSEKRNTKDEHQFVVNNKNSVLPPNLFTNIAFVDGNGNNFLDAKENGKINLSITNNGQGSAFGVKFDLKIENEDYNLTYPKTVFVGEILPNSTKQINIDISASKSVQRKTHTITLKGYESNGFVPADAKISFETFPLLLPELKIVDYGITSNRGDNVVRSGEISNLKIRFQNVGQGIAQNASIIVKLPLNVFFTPDSKISEKYESIKQGEFVDLDLSIVPNNLVANEVQINFLIKEENTEVNIPLSLPINKQLSSIQELVVKGEENKIDIVTVAGLSSDIEKDIPITTIKNINGVALVVGISDYQNSNVPKVTYARRDASLMRQYLEKTFGYDVKNILPKIEDELMTSGTIKNYIKNVIPTYLKQDGSSELFIYFTGHGAPSTKTRDAFFVPYDCDPNYVSDINAYNMNEFYRDISKLNAKKKIVVVDACFSGQSGDGNMLIKDASPIYVTLDNEMNLDDKSIMFLSSGPDQVSNWYPEKKHSMFTYFFLKGLQGNADMNNDGAISVAELEKYINDENNGLPYYSNREFQRPQKAVIYGNDLELISR